MSYRDELSAAQNRADALERELKEAKEELESRALVVRGRSDLAERPGQRTARRWLGGPTRIRGERTIDGEIGDDVYAEIVQCITDGLDSVGRSSIVPNRLDWVSETSKNDLTSRTAVSVMSTKGKTMIRGEIHLSNLAGAVFGGLGGGVGLGFAVGPGLLFLLNPIAGVAGVAGWLGANYWACRKIFGRSAKKRQAKLELVLDRLEQLVTNAPKRESS